MKNESKFCFWLGALLMMVPLMLQTGCGGGSGSATNQTSAVNTGTATLSWISSTTYTDNSLLTPVGYKIYYGKAHNTYTTVIDIPVATLPNPSKPTYTVNNLSRGTYYFAISVYDASKTESVLSAEVSKSII